MKFREHIHIQIHLSKEIKYPKIKSLFCDRAFKIEIIIFTPVTVTTRRQVPVFPASSVDEQFTVVSPIRYVSWDEWEQVTSRWKSTLSVAVEFSRTVDDELSPSSVVENIFGQFRIGASSSAD